MGSGPRWIGLQSPGSYYGERSYRGNGFDFEAPVLTSVDLWALLLSAAAIIAMFRFKVGMIPTLAACSVAGVILYLMGAVSHGA